MIRYVDQYLSKSPPSSKTLHDAVTAFEAPLEKTIEFLNFHWVNKNLQQLKTMLTDGLSGQQFQTPLMLAIGRNRSDIVEILLQYYRLLHITCTLMIVDSTHPRGKNAIDYAIANYIRYEDDNAWKIIQMVVAREHEVCTTGDVPELPHITATKGGHLADILAQRNVEFDALVGWVDVGRSDPSSAFETGPFDFRKPTLERILYGLEELALSKSNFEKKMLMQTLIRKLQTLSPSDKSTVVWLNEELVYLLHSLMLTTQT